MKTTPAKAIVSVVMAALIAASQLGFTGAVQQWITIAIAVLGAVAVYLVPNKPIEPASAAARGSS